MKLACLAARDADHCYSRQPRQLRTNDVSCQVKETRLVTLVGSKAVTDHRKNCEGKSLDIANFCGGRERARKLRQARLDQLQHLNDVNTPVEIETDFRRAARSLRLDTR